MLFPTPYPDELIYSVIARYHVRSGNTSSKGTLREIFGSATVTAVMDMPSNIDTLVGKIPEFMNITADDLILNHTLFPYYAAFLPEKIAKTILTSMKGDFGGNIHTRTGIMASTVQLSKYIRFCPECCKYDLQKYGEYYWHRLHQIPGVLICPIHNTVVKDSDVWVHQFNKHEFIAADELNCKSGYHFLEYRNTEVCMYLEITKDILWLMNNFEAIRQYEEKNNGFREQYLSLLKNKGLATVNGSVYQDELTKDFKKFYGEKVLTALQSDVNYDFENNWLASIVRNHRKAFHPLRHLLLMRYLSGSIKDFLYDDYKYKPFGDGPWLCLNSAAEHYNKRIVTDLVVTHCGDTKRSVGTFHCSCGFVYSRKGPDKNTDDQYKIGRIKEFGPVWENKLKQLVGAKLSLRETARRLNVDPNTVKNFYERIQLNVLEGITQIAPDKKHNKLHDLNRDEKREMWLQLFNDNPGVSKTGLRKQNKALYAWLYRNDRDWLNESSPYLRKVQTQYCKIDWKARDTEVLQQIKTTIAEMLDSDKRPERISISRIGKKIGSLALIEKHLIRMPEAQVYMNSHVETLEQFRIRRIKWAAKELNSAGEELKEWKIIRKAGIRSEYVCRLQNVIANEIDRYQGVKQY